MSDEAEKAYSEHVRDVMAARTENTTRNAFMAGRASRDAEVAEAWDKGYLSGSENARDAFERESAARIREAKAEALEEFAVFIHDHYPLDVFPKPTPSDYDRLNTALARSNLTLDRFSADLMRRAGNLANGHAAAYRSGTTTEGNRDE
jgi:hypothetical protein